MSSVLTADDKHATEHQHPLATGSLINRSAVFVAVAVAMPVGHFRSLDKQLCPLDGSGSGYRYLSNAIQSRPLLQAFPCNSSLWAQMSWFMKHWVEVAMTLYIRLGDWEGRTLHFGAALLLFCALSGRFCGQFSTRFLASWRVCKACLSALAVAIDYRLLHAALPVEGFANHLPTHWSTACLLWDPLMNMVPLKIHLRLVPLEFAAAAFCALYPCWAIVSFTTCVEILLKLLVLGVALPTALLVYLQHLQHASRAVVSSKTAGAHPQPPASKVGSFPAQLSAAHAKLSPEVPCPTIRADEPAHVASASKPRVQRVPRSGGQQMSRTRCAPGKRSLYVSQFTTEIISVKVHDPPEELRADPEPLCTAVRAAAEGFARPGAKLAVHHAVISGCIQLLVWVQREQANDEGGEFDSDDLLRDTVAAAAMKVVRERVQNREVDIQVQQGEAWADCREGTEQHPEGVFWLEGGRSVLGDGVEELVVNAVAEQKGGLARELLAGAGRVRVVLVEGLRGRVLVDEKVEATGGEGCDGVVSLRVPIAPEAQAAVHDSASPVAHLLVLPIGDKHGVVLWSTPLLLGAPAAVDDELQLLHADMIEDVLDMVAEDHGLDIDQDLEFTPAAKAAAAAKAYQAHLVPLVWDLLRCMRGASNRTLANQKLLETATANTFSFLRDSELHATTAWLQGGASHAGTQAPKRTAGAARPALAAVLRGKFAGTGEEQQFQAFLTSRTAIMDRNMNIMQLLLIAACATSGPLQYIILHSVHACAHLFVMLRNLGVRRRACDRQRVVRLLMLLYVVHIGLLLLWEYPERFVSMWRDALAIPIGYFGIFHLAAHQGGFRTTLMMAVALTLEFGGLILPHFENAWQVGHRLGAFFAIPCLVAFAADWHHRASYLRSAAQASQKKVL